MIQTPQTPEEFLSLQKSEQKRVPKGANKRQVAKVLRLLAPAYGYNKHAITRIQDACREDDLLQAVRQDAEVGDTIPEGLVIGGHTGLRYANLLSPKFREQRWWLKFLQHMEIHGTVTWVLPIRGAGYWVIHNTTVNPQRQQPAILIPARAAGFNHVRVIRLELFIEEHKDE